MTLGRERDLVDVVRRLSRQSKSIDEAVELLRAALASKLGGAELLLDHLDGGMSPRVAKSTAAFMDAREFPFRGLYTAPLVVGSRKVGRLVACFGSYGSPGPLLPRLTEHVAQQLSAVLGRTSRTLVTRTMTQPEAA
jgi:hypothetical protein